METSNGKRVNRRLLGIAIIYTSRRFPIFMRCTAPVEPVEPIEPFHLQSMGRHAPWDKFESRDE